MGKVDQGVVALWLAAHFFERQITIHRISAARQTTPPIYCTWTTWRSLTATQAGSMNRFHGLTLNVGGGLELQSVFAGNDSGMRSVDRETHRD